MFNWFKESNENKVEIKRLQEIKDILEKEVKELKEQVANLKLKKKIEDEDIRHMVKIKEESLELEYKRKLMDSEAEKIKQIAKCKDDYREKMEQFLQKQVQDVKEMYGQILQRLPDVNVRLKGGV